MHQLSPTLLQPFTGPEIETNNPPKKILKEISKDETVVTDERAQ
jgi:hypothetical protein